MKLVVLERSPERSRCQHLHFCTGKASEVREVGCAGAPQRGLGVSVCTFVLVKPEKYAESVALELPREVHFVLYLYFFSLVKRVKLEHEARCA